jgi:calcineurin-like phosphoesterase
MGWHLDGRVLAMLGTHTHVPTADARVLPGGTAYVTDVGMTGARNSVIGVKKEQAIERFLTGLPVKFETADQDVWIMGCLVESADNGLAGSIELVMVSA